MISMHTCPLAPLGGKNTGGMNVYIRELSRELGRRGVAVDIFTHAQNLERPVVVQMARNVRVIHIQAGPVEHIDKNELPQYVPEFAANMQKLATETGTHYDVIYSHYWLSGMVAELLRDAWGTPIVQMFHTLGKMKNHVAQRVEEQEIDERISGESHLMQVVDRLVAANPIDRQHMLDLYQAPADKITVIPCGADLTLFHPVPRDEAREELGIPEARKLVTFVGRIEALKGVDTLFRAVAHLVEQDPTWRERMMVAIVGGTPEDETDDLTPEMRRLRTLRDELALNDVISFVGAQPQETLPYFYSAAEVVVMPSHYESFGMVAVEATACGTPVIASNVGGLTYTIKDGVNGFLVPPKEPTALAERMEAILTNPALRDHMGNAGVQRANRFSWIAVADQILQLVGEVRREMVVVR
jgi:D-inositol-3-phosphate glycosyltransferase